MRIPAPFTLPAAIAMGVFLLLEWLLFELLRMPYMPPQDMTTLLGREKYTVIGIMGAIVFVMIIVMLLLRRLYPAQKARWAYSLMLLAMIIAMTAAIVAPPWAISPPGLMFQ